MAADVSSLFRVLTGYKDQRTVANEPVAGKSTALMTGICLVVVGRFFTTMQFLKFSFTFSFNIIRSQATNQSNSGKASRFKLPPSPSKITLNLFDETNLDLKLVSSPSGTTTTSSSSSTKYQSVCTLDKVKSALERAEKEPIRKRSSLWKSPLSPSYSSSSSSIREIPEEENEQNPVSAPVAAGCPGCLSYVLILKNNPKCPRCNSVVPVPIVKKPRRSQHSNMINQRDLMFL
ncbi:hypothetical protein GH714_001511 [Hevea brasiliensis]|uniref:GIR1-like zinc ribbon domain-containing protein n=1 Tax=Hevea brasiliensis TaxID=3981 RepID=A0A6A6MAN6_HEVBR|nr:hypothetical protein GH714_001511 [Hevea brasiliensis]